MTEYTADRDGERIDVFLARKDETLSRSYIQRLITEGLVTVGGKTVKPRYRLTADENVVADVPKSEPVNVAPEKLPIDILYEDGDVIVVNKARGMVVHPAAGVFHGTLVNALLAHCKDLSGINGVLRPGIVHRLDKETSGVMIVAKNDAAHRSLAQQIQTKTAQRVYWAILTGNIREEEGVIHGAIGRSPKDRQKMAVVRENGKDATTKFRVLERFGDYTLTECRLLTGRTHQIRVHMAYIGHPVAGDRKYGSKKCPFSIEGQALHSKVLSFVHPRTEEKMEFTAPLPEDMESILRQLRGNCVRE